MGPDHVMAIANGTPNSVALPLVVVTSCALRRVASREQSTHGHSVFEQLLHQTILELPQVPYLV
jgi:hypothetical protein